MTLWSGRFSSGMGDGLWDLSESYSFDHVLYPFDIHGSKAHVQRTRARRALERRRGRRRSIGALDEVLAEFDDRSIRASRATRTSTWPSNAGSSNSPGTWERNSTRRAVATTRWRRPFDSSRCTPSRGSPRDVLDLVDVLVGQGERNADAYLPGYTHLQRAQPVLLSHHLNAHAWALLRDVDRLLDARDRMNVSPLGAGALAGTSLADRSAGRRRGTRLRPSLRELAGRRE